MSISQYNYEAYFLDYYEGTLDAHATQELMDFLAHHPELKEEFESYEPVSLNDKEEIKFEGKESLKKSLTPVNANNFDEFAVQYIEGTLNAESKAQFLNFIKLNPVYENELALYQKTKLTTDITIVFTDKEFLKKRNARRPAAWYYWSAAASVAIIIVAYFMLRNNSNNSSDNNIVANNNHVTDTVKHAVQNIQTVQTPVQNNNVQAPVVVQHSDKQEKATTYYVKKSQHETPVVNAPLHDSAKAVVQNNPIIQKHDSVAITPAITQPTDSLTHIAVKDFHDSLQNTFTANNIVPVKKKSVFAFIGNAFKSIGSIFSRPVEVNKYYSASSDKVIAYQLSVGDEKLTLRLKNNAY